MTVLGVVPDPGGAPEEVARAVDALVQSGVVDRVVVVAPAEVAALIVAQIEALDGDPTVVVHDPSFASVPPELVRQTVAALRADPSLAAVVPVRPVTDTLKWVSADGVVLGTADRDAYRVVGSPQAYRGSALRTALGAVGEVGQIGEGDALAAVLPGLLQAGGGTVGTVPAAAQASR